MTGWRIDRVPQAWLPLPTLTLLAACAEKVPVAEHEQRMAAVAHQQQAAIGLIGADPGDRDDITGAAPDERQTA